MFASVQGSGLCPIDLFGVRPLVCDRYRVGSGLRISATAPRELTAWSQVRYHVGSGLRFSYPGSAARFRWKIEEPNVSPKSAKERRPDPTPILLSSSVSLFALHRNGKRSAEAIPSACVRPNAQKSLPRTATIDTIEVQPHDA